MPQQQIEHDVDYKDQMRTVVGPRIPEAIAEPGSFSTVAIANTTIMVEPETNNMQPQAVLSDSENAALREQNKLLKERVVLQERLAQQLEEQIQMKASAGDIETAETANAEDISAKKQRRRRNWLVFAMALVILLAFAIGGGVWLSQRSVSSTSPSLGNDNDGNGGGDNNGRNGGGN